MDPVARRRSPEIRETERSWDTIVTGFGAEETEICVVVQNLQERETSEESVRSGKRERPLKTS